MTAQRPIRFGFFPGASRVNWSELREVWQLADELGYATGWIPDHFYSGWGSLDNPVFEAWTLLAALAASTKQIRVGTMVSGNTYRHPAVLANMAVTVDHISNGRLDLGLGAGWMKAEHDGYGIPYPSPKERLDRLEEAVQVLRLLFTEKQANFAGTYYQLNAALCEPKPIQQPHPPIMIGGGGEKRTLRITAKYADAWNGELGPRQMAHKIAVLHEHCRAVGRDPSEIELSILLRTEAELEANYDSMVRSGNLIVEGERQRLIAEGVPTSELDERTRAAVGEMFLPDDEAKAVDRLSQYAALGITHFIVIRRPPYDLKAIERLITHVAPRVGR